MQKTIFQKIIDKELPCEKVFENERIIAFNDIHPQAPVHILIVPKKPLPNIDAMAEDDIPLLGEVLFVAKQIAKEQGIEDGFRLVTNNGHNAGQLVYHLHFHLLGGKHLGAIC